METSFWSLKSPGAVALAALLPAACATTGGRDADDGAAHSARAYDGHPSVSWEQASSRGGSWAKGDANPSPGTTATDQAFREPWLRLLERDCEEGEQEACFQAERMRGEGSAGRDPRLDMPLDAPRSDDEPVAFEFGPPLAPQVPVRASAELEVVFARSAGVLGFCFEQNQGLSNGKPVELELRIEPSGRVSEANPVDGGRAHDRVVACLIDRAKALRFPEAPRAQLARRWMTPTATTFDDG